MSLMDGWDIGRMESGMYIEDAQPRRKSCWLVRRGGLEDERLVCMLSCPVPSLPIEE